MPFNCDICGDECSYESLVLKLRNSKQEIVVCDKHLKSKIITHQLYSDDVSDYCGDLRPARKVFCQDKKGHEGSHKAIIYWE